ncbi:MAG: (2Fe-2S)-binding protein [Thermofilum sp.]
MVKPITLTVNGRPVTLTVPLNKPLARLLREDLKLTSLKIGCEEGECGACTVILDGRPVPSCILLASQVDGREVYTIEGLLNDPVMKEIQSAFIDEEAFQCGFCTPGFMITVWALINDLARTRRRILPEDLQELMSERLSGNLCRCGTYPRIAKAAQHVLRKLGLLAEGT